MEATALAYSALMLLIAGCANAPASASTSRTAPANGATMIADPSDPLHQVKKGMTAAEVRQLLGPPESVEPFPSQAGQAEIWIYTRTSEGPAQSVPASMTPQETYTGPASGVQMVNVPVYVTVHTSIDETTQLLIFEGHLVEWKQSRRARHVFDN